jgi:hypothetical protein
MFRFPEISISISMSKSEFRFWFQFRHRNFDSDFNFDFGIPISMSEFRLSKSKVRFSNQILNSVAEPHICYAASAPAPAPSKNFNAAPAAPATTLLYCIPNQLFLNKPNLTYGFGATFSSDFCTLKKVTNMNRKSKKNYYTL